MAFDQPRQHRQSAKHWLPANRAPHLREVVIDKPDYLVTVLVRAEQIAQQQISGASRPDNDRPLRISVLGDSRLHIPTHRESGNKTHCPKQAACKEEFEGNHRARQMADLPPKKQRDEADGAE